MIDQVRRDILVTGAAATAVAAAPRVFAQQTPVKRNCDAETQDAIQSAKTAAGFEHLGTLARSPDGAPRNPGPGLRFTSSRLQRCLTCLNH